MKIVLIKQRLKLSKKSMGSKMAKSKVLPKEINHDVRTKYDK